jgi:hypothetical protein
MHFFVDWNRSDKLALAALSVSVIGIVLSSIVANKSSSIQVQLDEIKAKVVEVDKIKAELGEINTMRVHNLQTLSGTIIE